MSDEKSTDGLEEAMEAAKIQDTQTGGYFINIIEDDDGFDPASSSTDLLRDTGSMAIADDRFSDAATTSVVVTDLPVSLFKDANLKATFEYIFTFERSVTAEFTYFKIFRRCRIDYPAADYALKARNNLSCFELEEGRESHTYLLKPVARPPAGGYLEPPDPDRVFLISPPASPPVGWEQVTEQLPMVNTELLEALAKLESAGTSSCELLARTPQTPGIVVHTCSPKHEAVGSYGLTDISREKSHIARK